MQITTSMLAAMAASPVNDNMRSVADSLIRFGPDVGLDRPHRVAHLLGQLLHESGRFRYDREVWGPTPAQKRYDTRTDLGNTPEVDGDGKKNAGRGPIQVTGGYNIERYENWCRAEGYDPPDFTANPDLINTDPWEGLSAIWYWTVGNPTGKSLNRLADENNIEQITKRINGGLNGFADRLEMYDRAALVLLGYKPDDIKGFQTRAKSSGSYAGEIDGESGPKTRSALHLELVAMDGQRSSKAVTVKAAPVTETIVEEKEVAVTAKGSDKRGWYLPAGLTAFGAQVATGFTDLPWQGKLAVGGVGIVAIVAFLWAGELIVRRVKAVLKEVA